MFVTHLHKGRGWSTGVDRKDGTEVYFEEGTRQFVSTRNLYYDFARPPYPLAPYREHYRIGDVCFDIRRAWDMIHPERPRYHFESFEVMRDLIQKTRIREERLVHANLNIPCLRGRWRGEEYVIDGNHRLCVAIQSHYTGLRYYRLSPDEMRYLCL